MGLVAEIPVLTWRLKVGALVLCSGLGRWRRAFVANGNELHLVQRPKGFHFSECKAKPMTSSS
jgi:hypothetical protein